MVQQNSRQTHTRNTLQITINEGTRKYIAYTPRMGKDILVSPANSRGYMCGGIDLAYIRRYGWRLENRVIDIINNNHDGYLAVGEATIVETEGDIPYLVVAPTMSWPPHLIIDKSVVGRCYAAILSSVKSHHNYTSESTVLMSGLGTLTGGLSAADFVEQIRLVKE